MWSTTKKTIEFDIHSPQPSIYAIYDANHHFIAAVVVVQLVSSWCPTVIKELITMHRVHIVSDAIFDYQNYLNVDDFQGSIYQTID